MRRMRTFSREHEPGGIRREQKGIWRKKNLKDLLASLIQRLTAFFQLTEAEQEEAGIHIEHQGGE